MRIITHLATAKSDAILATAWICTWRCALGACPRPTSDVVLVAAAAVTSARIAVCIRARRGAFRARPDRQRHISLLRVGSRPRADVLRNSNADVDRRTV